MRRKEKRITEEISERLTQTFVTPLEREDIDALALALYKIPKTLEKFAERFQISPPNLPKSAFQRQSELLQQAMETLELMVRELRSSPDLAKIKDQNLKLQYLEGQADKLMVERLKDLYNTPHDAISVVALKDLYDLLEKVIKPVVPAHLLDAATIYHLNPSGRFVIGGPHGDAGLTGRKIIIDTYGGWGAHGGGAFSGKDPSKVDRSAAYAARWAAKSLVKAGLTERALIQLSYAIGVTKPLSINVETYGTSSKTEAELVKIVEENFDFRPGCIARDLQLKRPIYQKTAAYGHFGRNDKDFTWEQAKELKA